MKTLEQIKEEWKVDCVIDDSDLGRAAAITPNLHAKYLEELINYKLRLTKTQLDSAQLRALKGKYFRGELTTEELKEKGWQQWPYRTLKSDIEGLIEADEEIQKLITKEQYIKTVIYYLESVLGELKSRSFHTRVAMDWIKFRAGG